MPNDVVASVCRRTSSSSAEDWSGLETEPSAVMAPDAVNQPPFESMEPLRMRRVTMQQPPLAELASSPSS
jgi:hypothetical protein